MAIYAFVTSSSTAGCFFLGQASRYLDLETAAAALDWIVLHGSRQPARASPTAAGRHIMNH